MEGAMYFGPDEPRWALLKYSESYSIQAEFSKWLIVFGVLFETRLLKYKSRISPSVRHQRLRLRIFRQKQKPPSLLWHPALQCRQADRKGKGGQSGSLRFWMQRHIPRNGGER
jgi:hypothetical protein